jgi:hypothetical protein
MKRTIAYLLLILPNWLGLLRISMGTFKIDHPSLTYVAIDCRKWFLPLTELQDTGCRKLKESSGVRARYSHRGLGGMNQLIEKTIGILLTRKKKRYICF